MTNKVDQIYERSPRLADFAKGYLQYIGQLLERLDCSKVESIGKEFLAARERGSKIIFIGNGGSAATSSHFANDLSIGTRCPWKPFKAISLTDNMAVITCIGNDFGYEQIFVKQLETVMEKEDLVVVISASGNSPNLLRAAEFAKKRGNTTIGLLGFNGGQLGSLCDRALIVETAAGEYGPVEDVHMVLDHLISSYLIRLVKGEQ